MEYIFLQKQLLQTNSSSTENKDWKTRSTKNGRKYSSRELWIYTGRIRWKVPRRNAGVYMWSGPPAIPRLPKILPSKRLMMGAPLYYYYLPVDRVREKENVHQNIPSCGPKQSRFNGVALSCTWRLTYDRSGTRRCWWKWRPGPCGEVFYSCNLVYSTHPLILFSLLYQALYTTRFDDDSNCPSVNSTLRFTW